MSRKHKPAKITAGSGAPSHPAVQEPRKRILETTTHTTRSLSFQGPLPHPALLEQYDQVAPDGANRIIAMAESQQEHRQTLEKAVVLGNVSAQTRGQIIAAFISLLSIGGGIWLIAHDKDVQGLVAIIGTLVALSGLFIYSRHEQAVERRQKRQDVAEAQAQRRLPLEPSGG